MSAFAYLQNAHLSTETRSCYTSGVVSSEQLHSKNLKDKDFSNTLHLAMSLIL